MTATRSIRRVVWSCLVPVLMVLFAACDNGPEPSSEVATFNVEASQEVVGMLTEGLLDSDVDQLDQGNYRSLFQEVGGVQERLLDDGQRLDVGLVARQLIEDSGAPLEARETLIEFYGSYLDPPGNVGDPEQARREAADELGDFDLSLLAMATYVRIAPSDAPIIAEAADRGLTLSEGFDGVGWLTETYRDVRDHVVVHIANPMKIFPPDQDTEPDA